MDNLEESSEPGEGGGGNETPQSIPAGAANRSRYMFSLKSDLTAIPVRRSDAVGARGLRLHVSYANGAPVYQRELDGDNRTTRNACSEQGGLAYTSEALDEAGEIQPEALEEVFPSDLPPALEGQVLSGADFLMVRQDGVLELDGRITILAEDGTILDATYRGLVDLDDDRPDPPRPATSSGDSLSARGPSSAAYVDFVNGRFEGTIPVQLSMRFETNTGPASASLEAEDFTWTKESRIEQDKHSWKYRSFVRSEFHAFGNIKLQGSEGVTNPTWMALEVYSPPPRPGGVK